MSRRDSLVRRFISTLAQKAANVADFIVVVECVVPVPRNQKCHLFAVEFDLEMFLLGLFSDSAEPFEHLDDVSPCDVVRSWMSEELLQRFLRMWHAT